MRSRPVRAKRSAIFHDHGRQAQPDDGARPDLGGIGTRAERASATPVLVTSRNWSVTRADLVAAQRLHLRRRWRQPRALLPSLFLVACAGVVTNSMGPTATWQQAALAMLGMLGMLLVSVVLRAGLYALLPLGMRNCRRRHRTSA